MLTKIIFFIALAAVVLAEETKTETKKPIETKKDKRGIFGFGYGLEPTYTSYSSGLGLSNVAFGPAVHSTVITKEVGVPVPHPVAVPVDRPVPYPVKVPYAVPVDRPYPVTVHKPYPVEVTKHVPIPVDRPVPVPVGVPYKVPVPAPYPVHIPQPYPVPVVKHVGVSVSQPIVIEKYGSGLSDGWSSYKGW